MTTRRHQRLAVRGLDMHVVEEGQGPLVLLCHGFPECWYSWRNQLPALAAAGFRAVAPDLRGYGATEGPAAPGDCDVVSLTEDLAALVAALGETRALLVGHDFGALLCWHAAALRPELFTAVACLSVGFPTFLTGPEPPLSLLRRRSGDAFHYLLYFQQEGPAEAELEARVRASLLALLWASAGTAPPGAGDPFLPSPASAGRTRLLEGAAIPDRLPDWLSQADLDVYECAYQESGFGGPLSWYRAIDLSWERLGALRANKVEIPALYMVGERDPVLVSTRGLVAKLGDWVPRLDKAVTLPGCGHWTQQERATEVNAELVAFLGKYA